LAILCGSVHKGATGGHITGYLLAAAVILAVISMVFASGIADGASSNVSVDTDASGDSLKVYGAVPVQSISLNNKEMMLSINETQSLRVIFNPVESADGATVEWGSHNKSVATVDDEGNVTGVGPGTATIEVYVTSFGKPLSATCTVTVSYTAVASVTLDKNSMSMHPRETAQLTAKITPENASDKTVFWTSDRPDLATVDATGKVTAVKAGTARITATTQDGGKTASCSVSITNIPVESVRIDKQAASVEKNGNVTLSAVISPSNASITDVTWSSNDPSIASIDANGKVTGHKIGTVIIKVTTVDGNKTNTSTVTVINSNPVQVEISPATSVVNGYTVFADPSQVLQQVTSVIEDEGDVPVLIVRGSSQKVMLEQSVISELSKSSKGTMRVMVPDVTIVIKTSILSQLKFATDKIVFDLSKVDAPRGYNFKMMASYYLHIGDGQRFYGLSGFEDGLTMAVNYVPGEKEDVNGLGVGYVTDTGVTTLTDAKFSGNVMTFKAPLTAQYVIYNETITPGEFNTWAGIALLVIALIAMIVVIMRFLFKVE
jgi:uncharacterized protein YjdB